MTSLGNISNFPLFICIRASCSVHFGRFERKDLFRGRDLCPLAGCGQNHQCFWELHLLLHAAETRLPGESEPHLQEEGGGDSEEAAAARALQG